MGMGLSSTAGIGGATGSVETGSGITGTSSVILERVLIELVVFENCFHLLPLMGVRLLSLIDWLE